MVALAFLTETVWSVEECRAGRGAEEANKEEKDEGEDGTSVASWYERESRCAE